MKFFLMTAHCIISAAERTAMAQMGFIASSTLQEQANCNRGHGPGCTNEREGMTMLEPEIMTPQQEMLFEFGLLLDAAKAVVLNPSDLQVGVLEHACKSAEKFLAERGREG